MDRFTRKMPGGYGLVEGRQLGTVRNNRAVVDRLAAYENTGLEPDQVDQIRRASEYMMFESVGEFVRYSFANFESLEEYRSLGTIDHLRDLLKAEQNRRLVAPQCKVGDFVYALWSVPTDYRYVMYCAEVKEIIQSMRNCRLTTTYRLEPIEFRGRRMEYLDDDFGKTVFLTSEEAEAAMEGGEG